MSKATSFERFAAALSGRYRIERELGEGGMATVYLAGDLKHDRQVAIKVLKPELAAVLGAERFVAEIKTTAQLQHPNILALFDSGEAGGFLYYVMPYVEGESLRQKLDRERQLGVAEAVGITTEVAGALEYAHEQGVVHRDIKPENILLHAGRPLVADFGIALAVSAAAGGRMTETGLSLGTPHYMSPEQATAEKDITGRSDIYSLASVLYEMLTGDPPHVGGSAQQIIAKIVTEQPPPATKARKSVPANVEAALAKALEKLPADRFGTAKAFAEALTNPAFRYGEGPRRGGATVGARPRARDPVFLALATVALVATVGLLWAWAGRSAGPVGPSVYDVGLPEGAELGVTPWPGFAVAPGGDFVVYQAGSGDESALWYRSLRDPTVRRIGGTDRGHSPALSPDGTRVAFLRSGSWPKWSLEVVSVGGGEVTTLGTGTGHPDVQWLDDGRIRVVEGDGNQARWFDPNGGATTVRRIAYCIMPSSLPKPDRLLCGGGGDRAGYVLDPRDTTGTREYLSTGSPDSTRVYGSHFRLVDGRYLVYLSMGGDLLAAPADLATFRVGRPVRLVTGIDMSSYSGAGRYAIARSGTLVYAQGPNHAVGHLVATDGRSFDTLTVAPDAFLRFSLSPDGRRLAAVVAGLQGQELRIYDLRAGESVMWVRRPVIRQPIWSPRGDRLIFSWPDSVFVGDPDESSPPELVSNTPGLFEAFDWMADDRVIGGRWMEFLALGLNLAKKPATWDTLATEASFPVMSPDRHWLAYSDIPLTTLWLAPMPSTGQRYQLATGPLESPQWLSPHELVFESNGGPLRTSIVRVRVTASAGGAPVVTRTKWMDLPDHVDTAGRTFALTPDGRVVYIRGAKEEPVHYLRVVPGWVEQMKRAVDEANR